MPQESAGEDNPRIKLKISSSRTPDPSQKLTLKFSGQRLSSAEDKAQASDSADGESLHGQKEALQGALGASPARGLRKSMGASPASAMRYSTPSHPVANASAVNNGLPLSFHGDTPMNANIAPISPSQLPLPSAAPGSFPLPKVSDSWLNATRPLNNGFQSIRRKADQGRSKSPIICITSPSSCIYL
jgi:hypothetical protein